MDQKHRTFDDLEFHPYIDGKARRAIMPISNGWTISVIEWLGIYASIYRRYECACVWQEDWYMEFMQIPGTRDNIKLCADKNEVNWAMEQFQKIAKTHYPL